MKDRRLPPAMLLVAAVGALLGACGGGSSATQSFTDPDRYTKIDVPVDWKVYAGSDLDCITATPFVVEAEGVELPVVSRFVFDGSPSPSTDNLLGPVSEADFPIGSSVVRRISPELRDFMSRYLLAEVVVDYHSAEQADEILKQDLEIADGYEGVQLMLAYRDAETSTDAGVFLISLTDPEVTKLYQVAVGCSLECFNTHAEVITGVVDSWLVNTRE
ncbi:MAG: hypothetical protein EHM57_00155 [Actinobacteria bacterium]|nr:MAG: hypothetical protein EHM57_00155 [Actinomycetota bacterium]